MYHVVVKKLNVECMTVPSASPKSSMVHGEMAELDKKHYKYEKDICSAYKRMISS